MATNLTTLTIPTEKIAAIEKIAVEYGLAKANAEGAGPLQTTITIATGIRLLSDALTPDVMSAIMHLQNTRLGFLTDNPQGYSEDIVKRCAIEAMLRGVRPVLNEMNIIAKGFYATKEAFVRLLKEFPGLTDLRLDPGVPMQGQSQTAIVEWKATWRLNGVPDELSAKIPVRVNSGMGPDAVLGKAERKVRARIYSRLTGSDMIPEGEVEEKDVTARATRQSPLDAFAGSKAKTAEPVVEVPWVQEETKADQGETEDDNQPHPVMSDQDWAGVERFRRSAKVSEADLEKILKEMGFSRESLPASQQADLLRRIKQQASGK